MSEEQKVFVGEEQLNQLRRLNAEIAGLYAYLGQITAQWETLKKDVMVKMDEKEKVIGQTKHDIMKQLNLDSESKWNINWKTGEITRIVAFPAKVIK